MPTKKVSLGLYRFPVWNDIEKVSYVNVSAYSAAHLCSNGYTITSPDPEKESFSVIIKVTMRWIQK